MSFAEFTPQRGATIPEHNRLRGLDVGNPHPQYAVAGHGHVTFEWINVTSFQNGWVNFGGVYVPARYCKLNGIVHLQGQVKSGVIGSPMFVLPSGYRPSARLYLPCLNQSAGARLDIEANGNVIIMNGAAAPTDAGFNLSFPADA